MATATLMVSARIAKHTSLTCKWPGPNHKTNATATNKLGGCTSVFVPKNNGSNPNKKTRQENATAAKATAKAAKEAELAAQTAANAIAIAEAVKAAFAAFMTENQA